MAKAAGEASKGTGNMGGRVHPFGMAAMGNGQRGKATMDKGNGGKSAMGKGKGGKAAMGKRKGQLFADTLRDQVDRLVPWLDRLGFTMSSIDRNGEDDDYNFDRLDRELRGFLSIMLECEQYRDIAFNLRNAFPRCDLSLSRDSSSSAEPEQPSAELDAPVLAPECVVCRRPCYYCTATV